MNEFRCFVCYQPGHIKAQCPHLQPPPPHAAAADRTIPARTCCLTCGVPDGHEHHHSCGTAPIRGEEVAAWARGIRASLGIGTDEEDQTPLVFTPYRAESTMPPRTENQLRAMAAQQARESRLAGNRGHGAQTE